MDTSREKAAGSSIRLRYSRQFQSGGHAHTIDAESLLSVGASQETRDQVIRELEASVEQLARQIVRQGSGSTENARSQTLDASRTAQAPVRPEVPRTPTPAQSQDELERAKAPGQTTGAVPPAVRKPVSESMPTTPAQAGRGEPRNVRLPQFLKAINTHLGISPVEAMELLNVATLDGLNYWDAYHQLEAILAQKNAERPNSSARTAQQKPVVEAPRSTNQGTPPASKSRPPGNQVTNSAPLTRTQGQTALQAMPRQAQHAAPVTAPVPEVVPERIHEHEKRHEPEAGRDFAGSPKAPIPIQIGTVRDISPRSYKFEEEDEEYEPPEEIGDDVSGRLKLGELKEVRGTTTASAGRLKVLDNIVESQVSEGELQKIIQAAWGISTKKKLKVEQVEALISWAKEDIFETEVKAMLASIEGGEE